MITIALSKGRIFDETIPLLGNAGIKVLEDPQISRKLILPTNNPMLRIIMVRASDVPTYVRYGGADIGIAGYDILLEDSLDGIYAPIDLNIAKCFVAVASHIGFDYEKIIKQGRITVATKYTQIAREYFTKKGIHTDLIKLYGSMELAPLVGMADVIVDLVSSGNTLKANDLKMIEKICDVSARLIINKSSYKTKFKEIKNYIDIFGQAS
jgi:ATP phosphoribosyltransferase